MFNFFRLQGTYAASELLWLLKPAITVQEKSIQSDDFILSTTFCGIKPLHSAQLFQLLFKQAGLEKTNVAKSPNNRLTSQTNPQPFQETTNCAATYLPDSPRSLKSKNYKPRHITHTTRIRDKNTSRSPLAENNRWSDRPEKVRKKSRRTRAVQNRSRGGYNAPSQRTSRWLDWIRAERSGLRTQQPFAAGALSCFAANGETVKLLDGARRVAGWCGKGAD